MCEGDDFWIDRYKLKKHNDFLESNPDTYLHVFDCYEMTDNTLDKTSSKFERLSIKKGFYSEKDLAEKFVLLPLTSCFRNCFELPFERYFNKSINSDKFLQMMLSEKGRAYADDSQKVAVYRIHDSGIWSNQAKNYKFYEQMHTRLVQAQYFEKNNKQNIWLLFIILRDIIHHIGYRDLIKHIAKKKSIVLLSSFLKRNDFFSNYCISSLATIDLIFLIP